MYRRLDGMELWHTNAGCVSWPLLNFEEKERPAVGRICEECLELDRMVARGRPAEFFDHDVTNTFRSQ